MLLEHSFVTTLEADAASDVIAGLARELGLAADSAAGPLRFTNGRTRAAKAKRATELPLRLWLEFDRGRVSLAASMEESRRFRKEGRLLSELLMALCEAMEQAVVNRAAPAAARARWDAAVSMSEKRYRRRRRNEWIVVLMLLGFIAGVITLAVMALRR